jgi:hypothetical protein
MATILTVRQDDSHRSERQNLVRHFVEMVLAMLAGMAVLGMVAGGICAALGHSGFLSDHAGIRAWVMALNMTIGMAVWMRYRGHSSAAIGEMGAAMFVPVVLLIGPYLAGAISAAVLLVGMHVLMLPAMVVAMLHRRDEYAHDHRDHRHRHAASAT